MGVNTIIFDIDETLVEKEVFPENIELFREKIIFLKEHGYSFGICTLRPFEEFVKLIVDTYLINDYIICEGGANVYKKDGDNYILIKNLTGININEFVKTKIKEFNDKEFIYNDKRMSSCSIKGDVDDELVEYLSGLNELNDFMIVRKNNKIYINSKYINKVSTINNLFEGRNVIFISDYERYISIPNDNVVMCSVGVDEEFNKKCHYVFDKSYNGVLKILKKEGMKYE